MLCNQINSSSDVSSLSPLAAQIKELWVVRALHGEYWVELRYWWEHGNVESKKKCVEWKAFFDALRIKSANLEY